MIRRPPRSTPLYSSAASDVYKRQGDGTAANGGSAVTGESALAEQQAKGKGRQSQTHDRSLGRIIRLGVELKDVSTVIAVTVATIIIVAVMPLVVAVAAIAIAPSAIVIAVMMVVAAGNQQEGGDQREACKAGHHDIGP